MSAPTRDQGPSLGLISDDVTGGLLVASYFEEAGIASPVALTPEALTGESPITILATRARVAPPEDARMTILEALDQFEALGCHAVAYKACASFDSTEEGNIGLAAQLLSQRLDQSPLLISAGFPEFRVTVHQGYLFYQGVLVTESDKRFDPLTPMPDPNLRRFLGHQTGASLGLVSHLDLCEDLDKARAALAREVASGHRYVLLDSSDQADIAMSARLTRERRALVASDPLIVADGLSRAQNRGTATPPPTHAEGPGAVLVGSVGPVAEGQLAAFGAQHPILNVDLLDEETTQVARALHWAEARIGTEHFAVTTFASESSIQAAHAKLGRIGAARKAERLLARIAKGLHERGVRRFVVSGGETSGAVVGALGLSKLRALPRHQIGGGFCVAEAPEPVSLFLKSGKLGSQDVLLRGLNHMQP